MSHSNPTMNDIAVREHAKLVAEQAEAERTKWHDEEPRAAHAESGGNVPHLAKRYYGAIGNRGSREPSAQRPPRV